MVSPTTPLERLWMMGRWGKSKNKLFPRKLLIKKYIPTDSGQKKSIYKEGKKKISALQCTKKSLKIRPLNTFLMVIPYAKSDSPR